jgi:hypothetical protein
MVWRCTSCGNENLGRFTSCQTCGDPKGADEKYEMPKGGSAAAPTVTDPSLLRKATAGPNWRCAFCGSDQRALDGRCGNCGASPEAGPATSAAPRHPNPRAAASTPFSVAPWVALGGVVVVAGVGVVTILAALTFAVSRRHQYEPPPPRIVDAEVVGLHWHTTVSVERYALVDREGFAEDVPTDAVDRKSLGPRHHHDDQVYDHDETQTEVVTVNDPPTAETTTVQVPCGQDCVQLPQQCHEECKSEENGFATCDNVCTNGGQSCTPKTCAQTQTTMVPHSHTETRSKQVPVYKTVPRDAEAFSWKAWAWSPNRQVEKEGEGSPLVWASDAEVALNQGVGKGEQERENRFATFQVSVRDADGGTHPLTPTDEADFARWSVGEKLSWSLDMDQPLLEPTPPPASTPPATP